MVLLMIPIIFFKIDDGLSIKCKYTRFKNAVYGFTLAEAQFLIKEGNLIELTNKIDTDKVLIDVAEQKATVKPEIAKLEKNVDDSLAILNRKILELEEVLERIAFLESDIDRLEDKDDLSEYEDDLLESYKIELMKNILNQRKHENDLGRIEGNYNRLISELSQSCTKANSLRKIETAVGDFLRFKRKFLLNKGGNSVMVERVAADKSPAVIYRELKNFSFNSLNVDYGNSNNTKDTVDDAESFVPVYNLIVNEFNIYRNDILPEVVGDIVTNLNEIPLPSEESFGDFKKSDLDDDDRYAELQEFIERHIIKDGKIVFDFYEKHNSGGVKKETLEIEVI